MTRRSAWVQIGLAVVPILLSVVITAVLILAVGADPRAVLEKVWEGAFADSRSVAQVINFWIPLTLASVGLIVTFTAGLWNIGVEGQMMMGAVFATWGALTLRLPSPILIAIEIGLAMLGGALWAILAGGLKSWLGVHEIFGGVALNALANVLSIYMISGPWQPPEGGSVRATPDFPKDALLPPMTDSFQVSLLALVIVVLAIVGVALALRGTRWGLQLKATGKNARSALLLGVPTTRTALSAFVVCGALAGIGGAYRVLFTYGSLRPLVSGGIGFLGLLVVLLVPAGTLVIPIGKLLTRLVGRGLGFTISLPVQGTGVPLVAFVFAAILAGSTRLKVALQLDASLAGVLQETLVLLVLLADGLRQRWRGRQATVMADEAAPGETEQPQMAEAAHE